MNVYEVGKQTRQGFEIWDENGAPVALVYGETFQEAKEMAERIADLLNREARPTDREAGVI